MSGLLGNLASCVADPLKCGSLVGSATGSVISDGANTIFGAWAADFHKAEATMLSTLMGSWLKLSTPNVSASSTSAVQFLTQNTAY